MRKEILDQLEPVDNKFYYRKGKKNLKTAFSIVIVSITFTMLSVKSGIMIELGSAVGAVLLLTAVVVSIIGILNCTKSYINKERSSADRFLILLGNLIIFGLFVLIIITNILDWIRFVKE